LRRHFRPLILTGLCLFYGATTSASAAFTVFDFTYSGATFSNTAVAKGQITLDTALLGEPVPFSSRVSGLSLTVSGATVGNGTFGLADYSNMYFFTGGVSLDFNNELVGQGGWGPELGEFYLVISAEGETAGAPRGIMRNVLQTNAFLGGATMCASPALLPLPSPSPPVRCWVPWASWAWCCVAAGAASPLRSLGPALSVRGPSWDGVLS
jgi:hypothetical protein